MNNHVALVQQDDGRVVVPCFFGGQLTVGDDDDAVADLRQARSGAIDADGARTAVRFNGIGRKTLAIIDIETHQPVRVEGYQRDPSDRGRSTPSPS